MVFVTDDIDVTVTGGPQSDDSSSLDPVGLSVGLLVVFLLCIIVAAVFIAMFFVRRKRRNVEAFQLADLTRLVTCICATIM